jgi:hypothetical protein
MRRSCLLAVGFAIAAFSFTGCGGTQSEYVPPAILLPPHIKSIAVKPFGNETSETGIGNKSFGTVAFLTSMMKQKRME